MIRFSKIPNSSQLPGVRKHGRQIHREFVPDLSKLATTVGRLFQPQGQDMYKWHRRSRHSRYLVSAFDGSSVHLQIAERGQR